MSDWSYGMGGGGWFVMVLFMIVFWALVIFAVAAIFRGGGSGALPTGTAHRDAADVLDERFARGEIDDDEYHARRSVLRQAR